MQKYTHIHTIYKSTVYIICKAEIYNRTKPFCFYEWYWIRVCVPPSRYELSITAEAAGGGANNYQVGKCC